VNNNIAMRAVRCCMMALLIGVVGCGEQHNTEPELLVYSARNEHLIKPLFDRFTQNTGIQIRYVTDKAGPLLSRLQAEGENSPADLLLTVDAGNLWQAANMGVLAAIESPILIRNVPAHLRDQDNQWFALTIRARTLVFNTDKLAPADLSSYEALAEERWQNRLCLRTSKKVYNQSLVATMIASLGVDRVEQIVAGWVANLALPPLANDTAVMEAVALNQCDVGIVNTYYYGRIMAQKPALPLALFWPNQQGKGVVARGVHVNVSGAGVVRASHNKEQAQQLIEWLTSEEAQQILMDLNQEYPVNDAVALNAELAAWGEFKADSVDVSEAGRLQVEAVKLMDRVRYR
jgi:iron(III) transport system substrate-binding protein